MRKSTRPVVIASRRSLLARVQAESIGRMLAALDPTLVIEFLWIESEGDQKSQASLAQIGGKGLFVRAVEEALLQGKADLAVHSLKDLPAFAAPGLTIIAVPPRADVRDCLVSAAGYTALDQLPQGAQIGTSSPRRMAQLLHLRPDLSVQPLRGNIETRLRKVLEEKHYDATLLAVAGLQRAGFAQHAAQPLETATILPAACQGALALQCRMDDHVTMRRCLPLNHSLSSAAVHAERQLVARLAGDCNSPIAVYVEPIDASAAQEPPKARQDQGTQHFRIRAKVFSPDGQGMVETQQTAPARHIGKLVQRAFQALQEQGAEKLLGKQ